MEDVPPDISIVIQVDFSKYDPIKSSNWFLQKKKVKSSGLKLNIINLHFTYTNRNAHATHQPNEIKLTIPQVEFLGVDLFD